MNGQSLDKDIWVGGVLPGMIVMWYSDWIPPGWLLCNGQGVGNNPKLRSVVGNNVPDFRGYFPRAKDGGRGIDPDYGRGLGSIQNDGLQNITGTLLVDVAATENIGLGLSGAFYDGGSLGRPSDKGTTWRDEIRSIRFDASRSVRTASETRPKNIAINFIIAGDNATTQL